MLEKILSTINQYHLNEFSDLLSLIITVIGFTITILTVSKSKKATIKLTEEIEKIRKDLRRTETVSDTASALALMEEIKRLHRQQEALSLLPERYSALRKSLIAIRSHNPILNVKDQEIIQSAVTQFATLERQVEAMLASKNETINIPKVNFVVSKKIDSIQELLVRVRNEIGDK